MLSGSTPAICPRRGQDLPPDPHAPGPTARRRISLNLALFARPGNTRSLNLGIGRGQDPPSPERP